MPWPHLEARHAGRDAGTGVFATRDLAAGATVLEFRGPVGPEQHPYTIQLGPGRFLGRSGDTDDFVNHSCDPNTMFSGRGLELVARRPIRAGEEVTYDYCSADWDLEGFAFPCTCGTARCRGPVRGYRWLTPEQRAQVPGVLPHLREMARAASR